MQSTKLSRLLRFAQDAVARRNTVADEEGTESGFTLIELMVVLLIMAILLAIAIPTFLGVKGGAQDRAAQSDLSNALISAKAVYSSGGSYTSVASLISTLSTQEPELTFGTVTAAAAHNIEVDVSPSTDNFQAIILVDWSAAGNCWAVDDNDSGAAEAAAFGVAPVGNKYLGWKNTTSTPCTTTYAETAKASDWSTSYPGTPLASL